MIVITVARDDCHSEAPLEVHFLKGNSDPRCALAGTNADITLRRIEDSPTPPAILSDHRTEARAPKLDATFNQPKSCGLKELPNDIASYAPSYRTPDQCERSREHTHTSSLRFMDP